MRYIASLIILNAILFGGVFDFYHLKKADRAYKDGNYQEAAKE